MKTKAIFYHAGCQVCVAAEQQFVEVLDRAGGCGGSALRHAARAHYGSGAVWREVGTRARDRRERVPYQLWRVDCGSKGLNMSA